MRQRLHLLIFVAIAKVPGAIADLPAAFHLRGFRDKIAAGRRSAPGAYLRWQECPMVGGERPSNDENALSRMHRLIP